MSTMDETRRSGMISSWVAFAVACAGAAAMALAFPKLNAAVLAPIGAAALFWAWFGLSPKRAFLVGWAAGIMYFSINFSWFGETAGKLIAPFGFFMTLGPAVGDALFGFALAGLAIAYLRRRAHPALFPLGAAGIFAFCEWLRSEGLGVLGVPFGSIGYSQVQTPFAPLGAFIGTYGITFVICLVGAYAAAALRARLSNASLVAMAAAYVVLGCACAGAWSTWPARWAAPPSFPVAVVQGNIAQSVKFDPGAFPGALRRYTSLTLGLRGTHPKLVVWPETVIIKALNLEPGLQKQFGDIAKSLDAELVVGSFDVLGRRLYNSLFFFGPNGALDAIYQKRQLVPFAEQVPGRKFLGWIPWAKNASDVSVGNSSGIVTIPGGMRIAPIICWESAFSGLNVADARDGATAIVISTDDAWFGVTAGPYQHAQIAQMRAIETGRWIVRSAATGISGIVDPQGRYVERSPLNVSTVVRGTIGQPVTTVYDSVGPKWVALICLVFYGGTLAWPRRRNLR
jgi:apolipoprotein N-acyltransferase